MVLAPRYILKKYLQIYIIIMEMYDITFKKNGKLFTRIYTSKINEELLKMIMSHNKYYKSNVLFEDLKIEQAVPL